ncbi:VIR-like CYIR protein [Plasmodium cynomolgi strain B]|uniref:VIR-like CYIR protein n=1 Tax=Plasmodium cynomolgi (strain B) TaxID=1120755 RepID=K6UJG7_PLACD|nr:VIR-like CYIR protein [Plasmodium cynomolgi strain B]GAB65938.1 VIR-like CYIR protein [Plasmodium cynomolgi strain B]
MNYLEKLCDKVCKRFSLKCCFSNYHKNVIYFNDDFKELPSCEKYKKLDDALQNNTESDNYCKCICCVDCSDYGEHVKNCCKNGVTNNCTVNCNGGCTKETSKVILTEKYRKPCNNICKISIKLSTILSNENNIRERCSYYNYWAFEQLWKESNTNSDSSPNSNVKNSLTDCDMVILQKIIGGINCKNDVNHESCYFYFDGTFSEWKKEKYMHDYFKNFDHLKEKTKIKPENKKYCEHVSAIAPLYIDYLSECCTYFFFGYHWDHCPNFFKCDKNLNPYKLLKEFNCSGESLPQYPESLVQSLIIDRSVILRSRKRGCRGLTCDPFYMTILLAFIVLGIFYVFFFLYKV